MAKEIYWRMLLNTKEENKAKKMSKSILDSLKNPKLVSLELYWKDKSLYDMELRQDVLYENPRDFSFEVIKNISKISNSWNLDLPVNFDDENFDFSGFSESNFKWNYINWSSFMIQDKDISVLDIS